MSILTGGLVVPARIFDAACGKKIPHSLWFGGVGFLFARSRFPLGMTARKARAKAIAKTKAGSLRK